jgi:glycosyltransferase involved in cell wall biosynthesis
MANYSNGLITNLRRCSDVNVEIISSNCICGQKYSEHSFENNNFRYVNFPPRIPLAGAGKLSTFLNRGLQAILNIVRGAIFLSVCKKSDIIHFQQSASFAFGIFPLFPIILISTPKKKIITIHNLHKSVFPRLSKIVYNKANAIIVHSKELESKIVSMGVRSSQINVIPHGLTIPRLGKPLREEITFFGEPTESKGAIVLLNALRILKDGSQTVRVHFYGICTSEQKENLIKRAIDLGISECILWGGRLSEQNFDLKMQSSSFTFALYTVPVSGSNIITRAMANGTPIIATNIGGTPEYSKEFGLLVPPNDPKALALAILKLLKDPKLRECMSNSALEKSYQFSWEKIAAMNLSVYFNVLRK